ncbi:carboxymuconolactone decarboxylase family protein [soil metagenome]
MDADTRYDTGLATLEAITGASGSGVVDGLKDIAPDFADWIVAFSYGDVMARPGLDRRTRQFATIAALTALGTAGPQLRVHLNGALNVGCEPAEIVETVLQMAVYAGFPATINGLTAVREVFEQRGVRFAPVRAGSMRR